MRTTEYTGNAKKAWLCWTHFIVYPSGQQHMFKFSIKNSLIQSKKAFLQILQNYCGIWQMYIVLGFFYFLHCFFQPGLKSVKAAVCSTGDEHKTQTQTKPSEKTTWTTNWPSWKYYKPSSERTHIKGGVSFDFFRNRWQRSIKQTWKSIWFVTRSSLLTEHPKWWMSYKLISVLLAVIKQCKIYFRTKHPKNDVNVPALKWQCTAQ